MRTLRLGRTGESTPAVALGTWAYGGARMHGSLAVGWSGHDDAAAREALGRAYELGITHWDTADVYGNGAAESLIASAWNGVPRERIFLASKVGWDAGSHDHFYHPDLLRRQLERSLRLLRTDRLDLYYFHHCDFGPQDRYLDEAVDLMKRFRSEGKVRFLGLSDWSSEKILRVLDRVQPDVIQPYRNLLDDHYESSGLKARVEELDLGVAFFSPLKHGLLLGKHTRPPRFGEGDHRSRIRDFQDQGLLDHLRSCRKAVEARFPHRPQPLLHALLGALLADAPSACVLVGMRDPVQVEAAAAVGEALSREDALWVRRLYQRQSPLG